MSSSKVTIDISSGKIYNPITKHEVKITSSIGKKLLKLQERGETLVSQADGYIELVRLILSSVCPDKDDSFIKAIIPSLKPQYKNAIASSIPVAWGGGKLIGDSEKKPKKVTAKKLFSIDQRDIMIKEHPDHNLKDINSMVSSKWLKISNKDRKDKSEFLKYKKLAEDANEDFEERMEKYRELHKNDPPRKLSEKDQEKIDAGTHVINPDSGRPMKFREEKQKKEISFISKQTRLSTKPRPCWSPPAARGADSRSPVPTSLNTRASPTVHHAMDRCFPDKMLQ